ncbi:hypothetical protein OVY01_19725 [Robbsia sp. Bb-Pol-6]|uniref:Uncharacterized protein n=1 Tax=Robbsia betulipollinis TaxID=2981849 RepID=A0ABT3ZS53_9BURK|nr:hypothetical protein [Robbsia betulipollinis]
MRLSGTVWRLSDTDRLVNQTQPSPILRRLNAGDADDFRRLRPEGLRAHPEAFGASWEKEGVMHRDLA